MAEQGPDLTQRILEVIDAAREVAWLETGTLREHAIHHLERVNPEAKKLGDAHRRLAAAVDRYDEHRDDPDEWPAHLTDDAPYVICDRCGRKEWDTAKKGQHDSMKTPDGWPCGGKFIPSASPR